MIESGGDPDEFAREPLQVNKSGDLDKRKIDYTDLTDGGEPMNPKLSATAGLQWLDHKGWRHDNSGIDSTFRSYHDALSRYNGKTSITPQSHGLPHNQWYADTILSLANAAAAAGVPSTGSAPPRW
jgi:hypothetical protein